MSKANWILTLEFTCDDGEGEPTTTVISQDGDWYSGQPQRAVNESVAITMSAVMAMLLECGSIVGESTMEESVEAFGGN